MIPTLCPAYLPNVRYFAWMLAQDKVFFVNNTHFQKQTYRNRTEICGSNGILKLTLPTVHSKEAHQKENEVRISDTIPWQKQHWRSICTAYRSSPYFEFYEDAIYPWYQKNFTSLYEFNTSLFEVLKGLIGIETPFLFSEKYNPHPQHLDVRSVLEVKKQSEVAAVTYTQVFEEKNGFIPNLSVLDLLFNVGPESLGLLKHCPLPKKV